jgi:DNA modification methylase
MATEAGWRSRIVGHGEADPAALTANPRNWRTHPRPQLDALAGVLAEVGWVQDVILNRTTGHVVDGHARIQLALTRKEPAVPVVYVELTPDEEAKVLATFDPVGAMAGADPERLAALVREVTTDDAALRGVVQALADEHGIDLGGGGAVPEAPEPEIDRAEELRAKWGTAPGQLWVIGGHRLLCGDSTKAEDVERLMGGEPAALVFTSPPYDQQRAYEQGAVAWLPLMEGVFGALPVAEDAQVLVDLGLIYRDGVWVPYWDGWVAFMRERGWRPFGWYVWDQGPGLPGDWNGRLAPAHEFIFHFNRTAERARKTVATKWAGTRNHGHGLRAADGSVTAYSHIGRPVQPRKIADSVLRVMRHKARGVETVHPAVFPIELAVQVQEAFSDPGDVCYEPFCGAGSSIAAGERTGRVCYGMEVSAGYVGITLERLSKMGLAPRLEA